MATTNSYNATAVKSRNGQVVSVQAVELHDGLVYRAAGHSAYGSGTAKFHEVWQTACEFYAREYGETVEFVPGLDRYLERMPGMYRARMA